MRYVDRVDARRTGTPIPAAVRPLQPIVPLLTRLVVAQVFINAGVHKLSDLAAAAKGFGDMGLPAPDILAGVVATVEVVGGAFLLLGLFTRVAALLLSGVMVTALATAHLAEVRSALVLTPEKGLTSILAFVMLALLAWLLVWGPGPISIDRWIAARKRRHAVAEPIGASHESVRREFSHRRTALPGARVEAPRGRSDRTPTPPVRGRNEPTDAGDRAMAPRDERPPLSDETPPDVRDGDEV